MFFYVGIFVAFSASTRVNTNYSYPDRIVFEDILTNVGDHYDPTTGVFICPVDGIYQFSLSLFRWNDKYKASATLKVGGAQVLTTITNLNNEDHGRDQGANIAMTPCREGQWAYIRANTDGFVLTGGKHRLNVFSGMLLHEGLL